MRQSLFKQAYLQSKEVQILRQRFDAKASEGLQMSRFWWNKSNWRQADCRRCFTKQQIKT